MKEHNKKENNKNKYNKDKYNKNKGEKAFALIVVLFFIVIIIALLGAYFKITHLELGATKYAKDTVSGFAAGEAGLNIRAEDIRNIFLGYNMPSGTSPTDNNPCEGSNKGSGDFVCKEYNFKNNKVLTYVKEADGNPINTTVPLGERYQNLNVLEYRYSVFSLAKGLQGQTESVLQLKFKNRLVPLFQFAVFYDKDLEIAPGATMTLRGPIHTNGDLYLNAEGTLSIYGQVTAAGDIYRGKKNNTNCNSSVRIIAPVSLLAMNDGCSRRTKITNLTPWKGMVESGVEKVTVPSPDILNPEPSSNYFSMADLRLQLKLNNENKPNNSYSSTGVVVLNVDKSVNTSQTAKLNGCTGNINGKAVGSTLSLYNEREKRKIRMFEVDLSSLFNCLQNTNWLGDTSKSLGLTDKGGIVFNFSLSGPDAEKSSNPYGVRISKASFLGSSISRAPSIKGLTIVTNQALYLQGDYNTVAKKPAAVMSDSFNILSNSWQDSWSSWSQKIASNTTINTAILSGTDSTGGAEGTAGQGGSYNGGLENYPRLHEQWNGKTLTYNGSFVSLSTPKHVRGKWVYGNPYYTAPSRNWNYDTDFNDGNNLPPLSPRFVYLRQELFVREF
ncbi:MAG: hypothetical protein ACOX3T_08285 [Bdellovibrionota bacterium]